MGDAHICVSLSPSTRESWRPLTPHELIDDADISWTSLKLLNTSVTFRWWFNGYYQLVWCALNCWGPACCVVKLKKSFLTHLYLDMRKISCFFSSQLNSVHFLFSSSIQTQANVCFCWKDVTITELRP